MASAGPSSSYPLPPLSSTHQSNDESNDMQPSSSRSGSRPAWSIHIPSSFLVLPPSAAVVGLLIGMSRGGSRARLRFLAENAHRPPKTVQGWYFYTKTRNYRIFFAALRTGARYAFALSAATGAYVLIDESVGYFREQVLGYRAPGSVDSGPKVDEYGVEIPQRYGWREGGVSLWDGSVAGGVLGVGVASAYRLPRPLFLRSLALGTIMGSSTSALQMLQARIGQMRQGVEIRAGGASASPSPSASPIASASASRPIASSANPVISDRNRNGESPSTIPVDCEVPLQPSAEAATQTSASSLIPGAGESEGPREDGRGWSKVWSWIPGLGR